MAVAPTTSAPERASGSDVVAAGAVVMRKGSQGREVLLVHRPKYDDWSFPKGKQDAGEHVTTTAVREVREETGVQVRLGSPLKPQFYIVSGGRQKRVHYWVGHVVGDDDVSAFEPNDEVDQVGWFRPRDARQRLTYLDDLDLLAQYRGSRRSTAALLVVRHAKAVKRGQWDGKDPDRPLAEIGEKQAQALAALLHAYGVERLVASPSTRCVQTLLPYAEERDVPVQTTPELSEEDYDEHDALALLDEFLASRRPVALCSHRPVLPELFSLLDVTEEPLAPAELVVLHHRRSEVVATERHLVR